jgi:hypothetical protein
MARLIIPDQNTTIVRTAGVDQFAYLFTFAVFGKTDLKVSVNGVQIAQSEFTLSGTLLDTGGYQGGTVNLVTPPTAGSTVIIWRDIDPQRSTNFAPAASVPVSSIDSALNLNMAILQDLRAQQARGIAVLPGESPFVMPSAAARANGFLGFGPTGLLGVFSVALTGLAASAFGALLAASADAPSAIQLFGQFPTLAAASATNISPLLVAVTTNEFSAGTGGGAQYKRTGAAGAGPGKFQSLDGRWWTLAEYVGNVRMFGAVIDGVTDDAAAWNDALFWANATGFPIYHPGGKSIFVGNMAVKQQAITGVDSYRNTPGMPISQTSLIEFHGNGAGITLADASSGGFLLEKVGLIGVPASYSGQIGINMADAVRPGGQNEGWPTLRDVSVRAFDTGIFVGKKYQSGWMYNVYVIDSVTNGYINESTDWYHYGLSCGSSNVVAAGYQMALGSAAQSPYSAGAHQVIGGAFFGAVNAVTIRNCFGVRISDAYIQNANGSGLVIGDGTNGTSGHAIVGCTFSGNNMSGGAANVSGANNYDIWVREAARTVRIEGCRFASQGPNSCVAAGIALEGPDNDGLMISGNQFNMDGIVTPGAPTVPLSIRLPTSILTNSLDHIQINDNMGSFGESGRYTFAQALIDMASLANPYTTTGASLSIRARGAHIPGATATNLPNPGSAGRRMTITGGISGAQFVCATAGALGSSHRIGTFSAAGYIELQSTSATTWQVLGSANCTLS